MHTPFAGNLACALIAICPAATAQPATRSQFKAESDKSACQGGQSRVPMPSSLQVVPENRVWHLPGIDGRTMTDGRRNSLAGA